MFQPNSYEDYVLFYDDGDESVVPVLESLGESGLARAVSRGGCAVVSRVTWHALVRAAKGRLDSVTAEACGRSFARHAVLCMRDGWRAPGRAT